ncbi:sterile alpha motif domain-containing protein 9-like [Misgurnus anguillicaudatus]|uniref:sterile alpha motif domain-containing protein 9-like n=1 Tax=Misgurnus anguillicaudatus TaxID=75329 RepID=UPI003CCF2584
MATSQQNNGDEKDVSSELPVDINDWNKDHVRQWLLNIKVDEDDAEILYKENVNGAGLLHLETSHLTKLGLSFNGIKLIIKNRDELKQELLLKYGILKPYPFKRIDAAHRYKENAIFDINESGPLDFIQPCHEFKAFTNTTEENAMEKYKFEVIRFAAACMNSRTNGTIHFGVADNGQILGISVHKKDKFEEQQLVAIKKHFQEVEKAKRCIMTPRFVEVLKADMTSTGKFVIEVDIEPSFNVCENSSFITQNIDTDNRNNGMSFFIRDGSSTKKLTDYSVYIANMPNLSQSRKDAEEKHLSVIRNSVEGSKLCEMLTGGTHSLDKSHFQHYILVANKSHPDQLENLKFLTHMNLVAVLDFDPESGEKGLNKRFKASKTNNHLPAEYQIIQAVEDTAEKLELTRNTSWVFCNGGCKKEKPSDVLKWSIQKGASVQDVVTLLCRKDVLHNKIVLIIFLLLSQVTDGPDPFLETFNKFLQGLHGTNQILCICDNKTTYTYWKDLIMGRYGVDISKRCISELSFAEINGTVLSLWSENRKSKRFLPGVGGSKVELSRDTEKTLDMLSILCVNQCDGGHENKQQIEENFYRGEKVSWWNFYFSEQPGSVSLIKWDRFDYIVNTIIPDLLTEKRACVFFHILHLPQRGATTLAMHVLWTFKDKYRCAVLKDQIDDYTKVAEQVVELLTYKTKEQPTRPPVLLMIDLNFEESDVKNLQLQIEEECLKQNIFSKSPQVILMNCMRVKSREQAEENDESVFLGDRLSEREQKYMDAMQKEFERTKTNTETFHGFMFLKTNFSSKYIEDVVKNTLKDFNFEHKHAQLFAILVLLDVYCRNSSLSVSTCEEFLNLQTTENCQSCTIEDGFENLSSFLTRCTVSSKVIFEGVRVINSSVAQHCLEELTATHGVTKAEITNILLTADLFNDCFLGKQKLMSDVHSMLCDVKRQHSTKNEGLFSPLIHDIMKETPELLEEILNNAAKFYRKDAVIFQLLARYYYINKKDFQMAEEWAKKAKDHSNDNSDICDTVTKVLKSELDRDDPIKPDSLEKDLTLAKSETKACKETQDNLIKDAEEKHLCVIKNCGEGPKLCEILTGGTQSLDNSHFQWYILVANKSNPVQLENLKFLTYMNLVAVLDFDPESAENGLNTLFRDGKPNKHLLAEYKITLTVEDIAEKLELTKKTSWVFCNGGYKEESPSEFQNWSVQKGSSVRDVVSFLCRKEVLPNKKFLIVFLLLSQVTDAQDPLLETFSMFLQELKTTNQILCICDNETTYDNWKSLIMQRYRVDISTRCISELSFAEINGTVLSLWSENCKSKRFLPGFGGSKVVLSKKTEDTLDLLSILCVNQCDGGNENKQQIEEGFYKGGKVSWWNFYFSEQPGSVSLIKWDKLDYIVNAIIPEQLNNKRTCVFFHIFHLPQRGATTLAMHVLWTLKDKYCCAMLFEQKDKTDESYTKVAEQVVELLTYKAKEQPARLPVLLMIDLNFKDCDVKNLQQKIEEECLNQNIVSKSPQVILMNCMRVKSREQAEENDILVFLGDRLSEREQKYIDAMQKEFERTNKNTEKCHGFMFLKTNFSHKYIENVV